MTWIKTLSLGALLLATAGSAAENQDTFRLTVAKGEAISVFRVEKRGSGSVLIMEQKGEVISERSIRPDDLKYLEDKVKAVQLSREAGCGREYFSLTGVGVGSEIKACGERLSATGKSLAALSRLLAGFR